MQVWVFSVQEAHRYSLPYPRSGRVQELEAELANARNVSSTGVILMSNPSDGTAVPLRSSDQWSESLGGTVKRPLLLLDMSQPSSSTSPRIVRPRAPDALPVPEASWNEQQIKTFREAAHALSKRLIDSISDELITCKLLRRGVQAARDYARTYVRHTDERAKRRETELSSISTVFDETDRCLPDVERLLRAIVVPASLTGSDNACLGDLQFRGCGDVSQLPRLREYARQVRDEVRDDLARQKTQVNSLKRQLDALQPESMDDIYRLHEAGAAAVEEARAALARCNASQAGEAALSSLQECVRCTERLRSILDDAVQVRVQRTHAAVDCVGRIAQLQHDIRRLREKATSEEVRERNKQLREVTRTLRSLCHAPHSFCALLVELSRRTAFKQRYRQLWEAANADVRRILVQEIEARKSFFSLHQGYLPVNLPLNTLQDRPHGFISEFRSFDDGIPAVSEEEIAGQLEILDNTVKDTEYANMMEDWVDFRQHGVDVNSYMQQGLTRLRKILSATGSQVDVDASADQEQQPVTSSTPSRPESALSAQQQDFDDQPSASSVRSSIAHADSSSRLDISDTSSSHPSANQSRDVSSLHLEMPPLTMPEQSAAPNEVEPAQELQDEILLLSAELHRLKTRNVELEAETADLKQLIVESASDRSSLPDVPVRPDATAQNAVDTSEAASQASRPALSSASVQTSGREGEMSDASTQADSLASTDAEVQVKPLQQDAAVEPATEVEGNVGGDDSDVERADSQSTVPMLSFMEFQVGSLALFHPRRRAGQVVYVAFHRGTLRHIIPDHRARELGLFAQANPVAYLLARITSITPKTCENPEEEFDMPKDKPYCLVDVEPFDPTNTAERSTLSAST